MRKALLTAVLALFPALALAQGAQEGIIRYYPPGGGGGASTSATNVWTGSNTFTDSLFFLADEGDATKKAQFQLSGITTATTRTFTVPNADGTLFASTAPNALSGNGFFDLVAGQAGMQWIAAQTPDAPILYTGPTSNSWIIAERADTGFDFAHPLQADPALFIHSHNQSTTEWIGFRATANGTSGANQIMAGDYSNSGVCFGNTSATSNFCVFSANVVLPGAMPFGWSATTSPYATPDTVLIRDNSAGAGANFIQMGTDSASAPLTQTFKGPDAAGAVTDILGGGLTLAAGKGTGAAASGPLVLNRQVTKASGTTAQTYAPAVIICPTKILSNTSATAQTIATITTTTTTGGTVTVDYANVACSGSTCDTDSGIVKVSWNNNAGTVAAAMTAIVGQSDSDATGTLAATPTATVATNVVSIKLTPTWVTIVPTSVVSYVKFNVFSAGDTVACQ